MSAAVAHHSTIDDGDDQVENALDHVTAAAAAAAVSANGDDDEGPLGRPLLLPEEEHLEPNDWTRRRHSRRRHNNTRHNKNKDDSSSPPAVGLGLQTFAYLIEPEQGLRAVTIHEALHRRGGGGGGGDNKRQQQHHAWIDAILSDDNAFRDLQTTIFDELDVSSFLRRHLNQPHLIHSPQVLSLTNALLMVMRIIDDDIDQTSSNNGEPNGGESDRTVVNTNVNIDNNNNDRNKLFENVIKNKNTTTSAGSEGKSASYTVVLCLEEGLMVSATKMASTSPPPPDTVMVNVAEEDENNNNPGVSDLSRRSSSAAAAAISATTTGGSRHDNNNSSRSGGSTTTTTTVTNTAIASMYDRELMDHSISGVLCLYLSYHLERTSSATHHLRDHVLAMLERLDTDVGSIQWREVVDLKNTAMRVSAVAEEQNQCILRLAEADASSDSFGFVKGSVNVLLSLAGSTERMVDRLEARVADVRGGYDAHQQDRIRHRLDLLTIMSAVFLPLTLLAGIWGMNFQHMPELRTQYGYFFALASMVAVALSLVGCFYWHGWLSYRR